MVPSSHASILQLVSNRGPRSNAGKQGKEAHRTRVPGVLKLAEFLKFASDFGRNREMMSSDVRPQSAR
jgi:hypothetical protein